LEIDVSKYNFKMLALAVFTVFLTACGTVQQTTAGSATGVNRQQKFSISSEALNAEAEKAYSEVMAEARSKKILDTNAAMVSRVKRITNNLITKTPAIRSDAVSWPWEVHVLTVDEENAWCMPHGKMAIYSGLINNLKLTDAEIAQVMAHEISHALREHSREQASRQQTTGIFAGILGAVGQAYGITAANEIASLGADVGFNLPFSRTHETEADLLGMELAARAGYNPDAASSLWDKMLSSGNAGTPQFLSSHPSPENRKATLQANAVKVRDLYNASAKK
jgi:predicted Zn-dependent protease